MPETGFHADDDWAAFTGSDRKVKVELYVAASDSFAEAIKGRGSRDGRRVEARGEQTVTVSTWHLVKAKELLARPPIRSKITSCGEVWFITGVESDPDDKSWVCSCILGKA